MNEVWDGSENSVFGEDRPVGNTYVRVNNSNLPIQPGTSFAAAIKEAARTAGLGKFRVYMNGSEILPANAPDTVQEGMAVELRPYDVAGC
jgi:hypothetical protein